MVNCGVLKYAVTKENSSQGHFLWTYDEEDEEFYNAIKKWLTITITATT